MREGKRQTTARLTGASGAVSRDDCGDARRLTYGRRRSLARSDSAPNEPLPLVDSSILANTLRPNSRLTSRFLPASDLELIFSPLAARRPTKGERRKTHARCRISAAPRAELLKSAIESLSLREFVVSLIDAGESAANNLTTTKPSQTGLKADGFQWRCRCRCRCRDL